MTIVRELVYILIIVNLILGVALFIEAPMFDMEFTWRTPVAVNTSLLLAYFISIKYVELRKNIASFFVVGMLFSFLVPGFVGTIISTVSLGVLMGSVGAGMFNKKITE